LTCVVVLKTLWHYRASVWFLFWRHFLEHSVYCWSLRLQCEEWCTWHADFANKYSVQFDASNVLLFSIDVK